MSGEYLNQNGIAEGSGFKRYGFRLNLDNKPREWATIGVNLSYNQTNENLTATNYGDAQSPLIGNALRLTPQVPVKNFDGTWGGSDPVNGANQYAPINPIALAQLITNNNVKKQILGGLNLAVTPLKGLTLRTSFNANVGNGMNTYYRPTYAIDQWHFNLDASLQNGSYQSWYWNWNQLIEYTRTIGKHNFTVMASHEAQESEWKALTAGRTGFLTNDIFDVNAGDPNSATNEGGTYPWSTESYLGRASYNYDNRYIIVGTFRRDGTPYFGADRKWGNFPSVSAAWRVSQEAFMTNVTFISELKLRYETGLTGNQGTGAGIYADLLTRASPWGAGFLTGTIKNLSLQWEETSTNNFGMNIGLFNNKISIEADYYVKNTNNLIMRAALPWYQGTSGSPGSLTPHYYNIGSLETKGWNLTINTTNISNKDFTWTSSFNISQFKTIVTGLTSDNAVVDRVSWWMSDWTQRAAIGYQPWLFRGYIEEGVFGSEEEVNNSPVPVDGAGNRWPTNQATGIYVGDAKYKDINGDGKITEEDITNIGNPWPKLTGGFTNTFSYKGFDLSVLITGTYGNDIYNYIAFEASNPNNINLSRNLLIKAMDYAKIVTVGGKVGLSNPGTTVPRMSNNAVANENNYSKTTSRFVEDGSYLRLKNVSLTYNVPPSLLGHTKVIKGFKATLSAQNLYTITSYKGYDPEVGAYVGQGSSATNQAIGIDFGRYPLTPLYTATISVNF
jgi:TonB-linked SusC/RagA family outer membrane protein